MIKKIRIEDLQVGMFIHDFQCGWNDNTIFIDKMKVSDPKIKDILSTWGIREVLIDTSRGTDRKNEASPRRPSPSVLEKHPPIPTATKPPHEPPHVPFTTEIGQAVKVKNEAIRVMTDITRRAHEGKPPDVEAAYDVTGQMLASIRRNRDALILLTRIRRKDEYTLYHSMSVSSLMLNFCNYNGFPEKRSLDLAVGALLHDTGKTVVPDDILNKPGKLTSDEFAVMKRHVEYSVSLLQNAKGLPLECFDIALHHHEKVDGSGYPHGLLQDKIGIGAQMTAICDVFDAITSTRCYKEGMGAVSGLKFIYENTGKHFNKQMAHQFITCMGVYPIGSCVKLSDGKIGIVSGRTGDMHKPIVKIFGDSRKKERFRPFSFDLSATDIVITGYEQLQAIGLTPASALAAIYTPI